MFVVIKCIYKTGQYKNYILKKQHTSKDSFHMPTCSQVSEHQPLRCIGLESDRASTILRTLEMLWKATALIFAMFSSIYFKNIFLTYVVSNQLFSFFMLEVDESRQFKQTKQKK